MIVNIAGTSGSGKSHLVRGFISWAEKHGEVKPLYIEDRKEPIGYDVLVHRFRPQTVHIVGAYSTAHSGGCDNIRDVGWVYDYIRKQYKTKDVVLYEGLFMMNMTKGPQLAAETEAVTVIQLTAPLSVCIASINLRRAERGEGPLLKKVNTVGNYRRAENYCDKMRAAGASIVRTNRVEALDTLLDTLEL